ncbi:MAG: arginine deiminase-related protein, partial [Cyclobacteriaceae bacterium]
MSRQTANAIMMIRPVKFGFNEETAISNVFQQKDKTDEVDIQSAAIKEFDEFVSLLRKQNIEVVTFEDTPAPHTPDSIFPNNWISTHQDGTVILYPMMAPSRRMERRADIIDSLENIYHFKVNRQLDYSHFENEGKYLEGTGSIVFDYANKIAYANISDRTEAAILQEVCLELD